jgi:hypothetical protein|tara:strand:+ start:137 stop:364 length:228 start_codon:yes stop_codon:yes gene_type:complete
MNDELSTGELMANIFDMSARKEMNMLEMKLISDGVFGEELEREMNLKAYQLQKQRDNFLKDFYSGGIVDLIGVTQ